MLRKSLGFQVHPLSRITRRALLIGLVASTAIPHIGHANGMQKLEQMERQIHAMQRQLESLRAAHQKEQLRQRKELAQLRREVEGNPQLLRPRGDALRPVGGALPPDNMAMAGYPRMDERSILLPPINAATSYGQLTGTPTERVLSLSSPLRRGQLQVGGLRITLGGYVEAASIFRSRNNASDISSNFGTLPFGNDPNHAITEFRETARQSRLVALIEGNIASGLRAQAYIETDFQASGSSSNSRLSNSYVLRERVFYGQLMDDKDDLTLLAGQNWSLLTLQNHGMRARDEQTPIVIDAQYIPGFTWTRNPQIRIVKGFDHSRYNLGLSIESPQQVIAPGPGGAYLPSGATHSTFRNPGVGINNPSTDYSTDIAPDVIAKFGADPGWGHYEIYGLMRVAHSRVTYDGYGKSATQLTGGGGGGAILPLEKKHKINLQLSGLFGKGIGRYSSANTPDATIGPDGQLALLPAALALAGIYGNISPSFQLFAYAGTEAVLSRQSFMAGGLPYGYGNPLYQLSGCQHEGAPARLCQTSIRQSAQGTAGFWWTSLHGDYGTLRIGAQYSYTTLWSFSGVGGEPHTDAHMAFLSFRYLPFQ